MPTSLPERSPTPQPVSRPRPDGTIDFGRLVSAWLAGLIVLAAAAESLGASHSCAALKAAAMPDSVAVPATDSRTDSRAGHLDTALADMLSHD